MIKLVLSDMDGTLVPFGKKAVSERTLAAIHTLRSRGIEFGPASGREPVDLVRQFRGDTSCFSTGILANGKLVRKAGQDVFRHAIDHEALAGLSDLVEPLDEAVLLVYVPEDELVNDSRIAILDKGSLDQDELESALAPYFPQGFEILHDVPDQDIYTAGVACTSNAAADALRPRLEAACPSLDFVKPAPAFFDVLPKGISKASALKVFRAKYGIRPEEVVFFGDSENDLALLEAVPNSIAVANGTPAAQAAARYHVADAAEDSVAQVMEAIARTGELDIPASVSRD